MQNICPIFNKVTHTHERRFKSMKGEISKISSLTHVHYHYSLGKIHNRTSWQSNKFCNVVWKQDFYRKILFKCHFKLMQINHSQIIQKLAGARILRLISRCCFTLIQELRRLHFTWELRTSACWLNGNRPGDGDGGPSCPVVFSKSGDWDRLETLFRTKSWWGFIPISPTLIKTNKR